jgi:F-type H+-transporting ATPase subunit b
MNLVPDITLLYEFLIFVAVMVSLNYLIFKPLSRLNARRQENLSTLSGDIDILEARKAAAQDTYSRKLEVLRGDILTYKSSVKADIDRERDKIIEGARQKTDAFLAKEGDSLKREVDEARSFLHAQIRHLADTVFTKIMGRSPAARS